MSNQEKVLRDLFTEIVQKLFSAGIGVEITNNKIDLQIPVKVRNGGTGTDTLTGYVKGNGDAAFTASETVPAGDISGVVSVENGGTGSSEINGYLFGKGKNISGAKSIPVEDVSGLGDLSVQQSSNVKITGGLIASKTIDGDIVGNANSINSVLPIEKGGTGVKTKDELQKVLGYAQAGENEDITSLSGMTTPLSVKQGGTGSAFIKGYVKGVDGNYVGTDKIRGDEIQGDIVGNAANVNSIVSVSKGGTGVGTLTGYVTANGDKPMKATLRIPAEDITGDIAGNAQNVNGVVLASNGGTGLVNPTGYLIGTGKQITASETVAFDHVKDLADMAKQSSDAVEITGGSATLNQLSTSGFQFTGTTHQSYTMTNNMPLMHPVGFMEIKVGNKICKVPYYEY